MARIVDFSETDSDQRTTQTARMPSDRFRMRQQSVQNRRRKLWYTARIWLRLALLPLLIGLWIAFPALPFWAFHTANVSISGTDANLTRAMVQTFLAPYEGQSMLTINPADLSARFKQQYPLAYAVWFRRQLGCGLTVHVDTQKPWAQLVNCQTGTCQPWAVFTDRYMVLPSDRLPPPTVAPVNEPTTPIAITGNPVTQSDAPAVLPTPGNQGSQPATEPLLMLESVPDNPLLTHNATRKQLALLLQQLTAVPKLTFKRLDMTNPINLIARFEQVDVQLGQLDERLTTQRLPRLAHLVTPIISGRYGQVDRVDLRWEKEVTFHRKGNAQGQTLSNP